MLELVGMVSFIIIILIVIAFFIFSAVKFIDPTPIQVQLFGIHLTLFGGILLFSNLLGTGYFIMVLGLVIGVYGSFKSNDSGHETEQVK
ncbi:Na+-transporting NADH:ubiquinone oxidoreductase subunit NqrF [Alkalibacillus filiformis]|uniref:Na+-transporting NADH:ubiquinone oxidoreductase subunit NqrF n=1 Tax=Alkalibacillus filiformis TaxID=200990 RepID=A0ABU0DX43_9BACI|nr:hypothetical protein [Alkalibacillus filiformis]MDQ0353042.1 Na+-transporting NADH:ubiquinone oxidoreductase subunit NqrF [Alkalibacillus filiformis]